MKLKDLMCRQVVSVAPEESAATASRFLSRYNIGALPVCTADRTVRGVITDRDIVLRCVAAGLDPAQTRVRDIMTTRVVSLSPEDEESAAADLMSREQVRRVMVCRDGKLEGVVSLGDLVRSHPLEASQALSDICENLRRV